MPTQNRGICGCTFTSHNPSCITCRRCTLCCNSSGECRICTGSSCLGQRITTTTTNRVPAEHRACRGCNQCSTCCQTLGVCRMCSTCSVPHAAEGFCSNCNECIANSCACWSCQGCQVRRPRGNRQCRQCATCMQCCQCRPCPMCNGARQVIWCNECSVCSGHCVRHEEHVDDWVDLRPAHLRPRTAIISFSKRPLKFWNSEPTQFKRNSLKRHISVEIECDEANTAGNGRRLAQVLKKWSDSTVTDGSLSGNCAHEINTSPSNGDLFLTHIEQIVDAYKDINASCSKQCGLHVHINCQDLKFYDLRKVILLYARTEKALFELCRNDRANASFSRLCGKNYANMSPDPDEFRRQLLGKFYSGNEKPTEARPDKKTGLAIKKAKEHKYIGVRYRALNLHSFFLRKTIEFRHHEGSVDAETITNWGMVCAYVIEAANKLSEAQIRALPENSRQALATILPENLREWCEKVWEKSKINWEQLETANKPDLPIVPKEEALDKRGLRKKFRAERRAKKKINEYRLTALRAIISGVRFPTTSTNSTPPVQNAVSRTGSMPF